MNGFISKYRWVIVILVGGLAAGLTYYSRQDTTPVVVVAEKTDVAVDNVEADEPTDVAPDATEDIAPTEVVVAEDQPSADVVVQEDATQVEEAVADVQEPEAAPSEPATVEVVEDIAVAEVVIEEAVADEEPAAEPDVEVTEEAETAVIEGTVPEVSVEPAVAVSTTEPTPTPAPEVEESAEVPVEDASDTTNDEQAVESDVQTNEVAAVVEELASTITATSDEEITDAVKPTFDVVRVDPTGSAVIAGTAEPFSKVVILSNGEDIGEAIAGSSGEFVAIIQVPDNEQGQTLELETEIDGQLLFSDETILILPIMHSEAAEAIAEELAPPIIRATAEEVVILQGAPQLALGQVSLDSISYDENDEVVLAGRGNPGRTIIIYVDDAPLMDTVVSDSGSWKQALHGLDAGRYVLRVDEIDDDGNVTSRVESPFQREYPEDVREAKAANDTTYTVQPGNSLWLIATGRYGDGMRYHQIFSANKDQIRDPDLIYPGQVFAIPDEQE